MKKKTTISLLIASTVCSIIYGGLLFLPYFADINSVTKTVNHVVLGYQIGFGVKGLSDVALTGSNLILACQLFGIVAGILSIAFTIYYIVSKKRRPVMYFCFGLTIPGMALAAASIMVAWPLYQRLNATKNDYASYSWVYFVSLAVSVVSFLINCFLLVYLAMISKKEVRN